MKSSYVHSHESWHSLTVDEVLTHLESDPETGLTQQEATSRLEEFGKNELPARKQEHPFIRFIKHFHDILIYILFAAALITCVLGHYADTVVILLVAIINAAIGYFQENKAEKALENIQSMLSPQAEVLRDGTRDEVDAVEVAIGDILLLEPGDKAPADMRLISAHTLKMEESALTGEGVPVDKRIEPIAPGAMLADRDNMVYSGTTVSAGSGTGVVTETGAQTELGKINQLMSEVEPLTTPLLRQTNRLGTVVAVVILAIAVLVYLFGHFYRNYPASELLLSTIGLAIAAVPEGLPAIISITLAIGVQNMARRKAIVRTLPAVETLGSVSVICSDKTGTLTKNEMTARSLAVCDGLFNVEGTGYAPEGRLLRDGEAVNLDDWPALKRMVRGFGVNNDAALVEEDGHWVVRGDPTDGALLSLFQKVMPQTDKPARVAAIPFDSQYKYMATLVHEENDPEYTYLYIKGAPDRLLEMAEEEWGCAGNQALNRAHWEEQLSRLAEQGQRVMGGAFKKMPKSTQSIDHPDLESGVVFLGLAGIVDPPREEVIDSIAACRNAGIAVKMITGDHADTARAIGRELGIGNGEDALTGRELDAMSPEQVQRCVRKYDIFARTTPEHKLKLVTACQANGSVCAMTGDGVNDAPALRKADVGIAMGIKGTEVTKEAAEIVLADDNFSTIAAAVEEGRRVYDNLKKTILFILPTNGAESFLIIASILFGAAIPLTPLQILWVNMVTSVTISLALAFEPIEQGAMERQPRDPRENILSLYFAWRILFVSVLMGGLTLLMNLWLLEHGADLALVRTVTLQSIVMCQVFHLFNVRSVRNSFLASDFFSNKVLFGVIGMMLILQLGVTYLPFMNRIFATVPLPGRYWLIPLLLGAIVFVIVELEKYAMRLWKRPSPREATPGGLTPSSKAFEA